MDIDTLERWVVVKNCPIAGGSLPVNSEIQVVHGCVYFNGGLLEPFYQKELMELLTKERQKPNFLKKLTNIYNQL